MDKQDFLKEYQDTFKEPGKDVFFSPGRINVIGNIRITMVVMFSHVQLALVLMVFMVHVKTLP